MNTAVRILVLLVFGSRRALSDCVCDPVVDLTLLGPGDVQIVTSPGYPEMYCNDLSCLWTITAPVGYTIKVSFPVLSLKPSNDIVTVHDGPLPTSPTLATCTGYGSCSEETISTGPNMVLKFTTNASKQSFGFVALIEVDAPSVTMSLPIVRAQSELEALCTEVNNSSPAFFYRNKYGDRCFVLNRTLVTFDDARQSSCNGYPNGARLATFEIYTFEDVIRIKDLFILNFGEYESETVASTLWLGLIQTDNSLKDEDWYWLLDDGAQHKVPNPDPAKNGEYFMWGNGQPNDILRSGERQDCGAFTFGEEFGPSNVHDYWCNLYSVYAVCQFGEENSFDCTCKYIGTYPVADWGCTIPNKEPCACASKYFQCTDDGASQLRMCENETIYDRISKSCLPKSEVFDCLPAFRSVEEQFCYSWSTQQNPSTVYAGSTCYMLNRTLVDYGTAKSQSCSGFVDVPGHLASFDHANDWEEMRQETSFLLIQYLDFKEESGSTDDNNFWIGLEQSAIGDSSGAAEGWSWVMGGSFQSTPNLWGDGQPDDNGDQDCGVLRYQITGTYLDDKNCNSTYYALCELPMQADIAAMEFYCSSRPDGNYKHNEGCSRKFYSCWAGVTYYRLCPEGQIYEKYGDMCTPDISACGLTSPLSTTPEPNTCTTTTTTSTTTTLATTSTTTTPTTTSTTTTPTTTSTTTTPTTTSTTTTPTTTSTTTTPTTTSTTTTPSTTSTTTTPTTTSSTTTPTTTSTTTTPTTTSTTTTPTTTSTTTTPTTTSTTATPTTTSTTTTPTTTSTTTTPTTTSTTATPTTTSTTTTPTTTSTTATLSTTSTTTTPTTTSSTTTPTTTSTTTTPTTTSTTTTPTTTSSTTTPTTTSTTTTTPTTTSTTTTPTTTSTTTTPTTTATTTTPTTSSTTTTPTPTSTTTTPTTTSTPTTPTTMSSTTTPTTTSSTTTPTTTSTTTTPTTTSTTTTPTTTSSTTSAPTTTSSTTTPTTTSTTTTPTTTPTTTTPTTMSTTTSTTTSTATTPSTKSTTTTPATTSTTTTPTTMSTTTTPTTTSTTPSTYTCGDLGLVGFESVEVSNPKSCYIMNQKIMKADDALAACKEYETGNLKARLAHVANKEVEDLLEVIQIWSEEPSAFIGLKAIQAERNQTVNPEISGFVWTNDLATSAADLSYKPIDVTDSDFGYTYQFCTILCQRGCEGRHKWRSRHCNWPSRSFCEIYIP